MKKDKQKDKKVKRVEELIIVLEKKSFLEIRDFA